MAARGQAGSSVSAHLMACSIAHVVFEKHRAAHAWCSQRGDAFCLVAPNWQCRVPDFLDAGPVPRDFTPRDAVVASVEDFARAIAAPVREGVSTDDMTAAHAHRLFQNRNRLRRHDGAWRRFESYAQPLFDEEHRYLRHVGVSIDVIATVEGLLSMNESEHFSRTLVEGVPQRVWRAVDSGRWTWVSPQWIAYTGQAEVDSHGSGWLAVIHPDDRDGLAAEWSCAVESDAFHADCRVYRAGDGAHRWFQHRATPVRDEGGAIVEWLGTSTDVHDLRQIQARQQVLLAEPQYQTRNFRSVVRATVDGTAGKVTLTGPNGIALRSSTVQILALALHELATNAVKYGALAQAPGRLAIAWHLEPAPSGGEPRLHVAWRESGVAMPSAGTAPQGTGLCRQLIERALPYQLGAKTTYVMGPDGIQCSIAVPASSRMSL